MTLLNNPHSVSGGDGYPRTFADQAWMWAPDIAHTWYTGSDKHNTWASTVNNVLQNYRGAQYFQKPGAWNFAGDLWCGTGEKGDAVVGVPPDGIKMTVTEEQSTYALWTIMAAPPMLGCDIRHLSAETLEYLSNPELLAVNQDKWGLQGSVVSMGNGTQVLCSRLSRRQFVNARTIVLGRGLQTDMSAAPTPLFRVLSVTYTQQGCLSFFFPPSPFFSLFILF